ncbi:TonB-linked SusC/RagA family outer membrane protein [Pedobacter sp. UYP30]|uniref:SusC/RagA family TonB-linked outer membrane protein n=1 Tax=Pedobacter sp. UYP30 TaxID=1756400 RepID=UPI003390A6E4
MKKNYLVFRLILVSAFSLFFTGVFAQNASISGKVIDETDQSLPAAVVSIKGRTAKTLTDVNGNFSLSGLKNGEQVVTVTFLGYQPQSKTINLQGNASLTFKMLPAAQTLNDVAVIGYGTVKKSDATGALSIVTAKDLNKGAVNSVQDAIVGKIPGVVVTSTSGAPGNTSTIRIRGGASLSASNDPLIVIDNVPIDNGQMGGSANILATINPNDIANITVLKDASATAIYGARASNGVLLITTKRGGKETKVNYSFTGSLATNPNQVKVYTGDEFRAKVKEFYGSSPSVLGLLGSENTNWQNEIYKNAFGQDHNVSVSGTAATMPYRVSLGYNNTDGVLKTYNFSRTTLAVGLDPSFFKDALKLHLNLKGLYNTNNFAEQGAVGNAVSYDPTQPVYNGNTRWRGYTTWTTGGDINGPPVTLATPNPVAQLDLTDNKSTVRRSIGNLQFDYALPFLKDLHANLNLGYDYAKSLGHNNLKDSTQWVYIPVVAGGRSNNYTENRQNQLVDFYLNYKKDFSNNQNLDITGGYSWSHSFRKGHSLSADEAMTLPQPVNDYRTQYYLISFFGRANYSINNKYLFTATLRDDASSRFAHGNQWGLFPAGAVAWKIKEENFLKNNTTISELKLRVGYGITGQQDLPGGNNYPYLAKYTVSDQTSRYQLGDEFYYTLRPDGYDPLVKWESTATFNVGLDFGFFNNRLTGSAEVYSRKTDGLLSIINPAIGTNFSPTVLSNVGNVSSNGAELNLNGILISKKDLKWQMGYNLSFNKTKITRLTLSNNLNSIVATGGIQGTTSGQIQAQKVGYPINSFFVYQQIYDTNGLPIEDAYVDRNNDGVINSSDLYIHKSPSPKVLMGINSTLNYRQWDFSFSGRLSLGNYNYNNVAANSTYRGFYSSLGFLSNPTTAAEKTKFLTALKTNLSDFYIEDASFFRMDNINVGYNLKNLANNKLNLRLSAGVQNVFVITNYTGLDPEISGGLDNNFFPRSRMFQFGLNVTY